MTRKTATTFATTFATALIAVATLSAPAALAKENPGQEARAEVQRLLEQESKFGQTAPTGQSSVNRAPVEGEGVRTLKVRPDSPWADNWRGGRFYPPSGK
ncbi:MAG: hypothetical protein AAF674_22250 [Pseudomonadota bacterium]